MRRYCWRVGMVFDYPGSKCPECGAADHDAVKTAKCPLPLCPNEATETRPCALPAGHDGLCSPWPAGVTRDMVSAAFLVAAGVPAGLKGPEVLTRDRIDELLEAGRAVVRDAAYQTRGLGELTDREWNLVLK